MLFCVAVVRYADIARHQKK